VRLIHIPAPTTIRTRITPPPTRPTSPRDSCPWLGRDRLGVGRLAGVPETDWVLLDPEPRGEVLIWLGEGLAGFSNVAARGCVTARVWVAVASAVRPGGKCVGRLEVADGPGRAVSSVGEVAVGEGVLDGVWLGGGMVGTVWACLSAFAKGTSKNSPMKSTRPATPASLGKRLLSSLSGFTCNGSIPVSSV
jgi:hypothetical protein